MTDGPVVSFDIVVLPGLAGLDMAKRNAVTLRPLFAGLADIPGAMINPDRKRPPAPSDDLVKWADDAGGGQREVNLHAKAFAV